MIGRPHVGTGLVVVSESDLKAPWGWRLLLWLFVRMALLGWWTLRHPVDAAVLVGLGWLGFALGWKAPLVVLAVGLVGMTVWAWCWRSSFDRWVWWPFVSRIRGYWTYRQRWVRAMIACGLSKTIERRQFVPRLVKVACSPYADRVTVKMVVGQHPDHYAKQSAVVARAFGAREARISSAAPLRPIRPTTGIGWWEKAVSLWEEWRYRDRPERLTITVVRHDPLAGLIPAFKVPLAPNLRALPVALREDGGLYLLNLLEVPHLLIAGVTGSGKGSVIWSVIGSLAGLVRAGIVRLWVIDPKGGMELAFGRNMFEKFCYGDDEEKDEDRKRTYEHAYADMLEEAVVEMRRRQARLRGVTRSHTPTVDEPAVVIVIDEMASLTAYVVDRDAKKRIAAALSLLLSQGRAVGVRIVAAVQDVRKEVLPFRDLFPGRIALRLSESSQVDLVLNDGARDRGAFADRISAVGQEGVAYVVLDTQPEPVRIRFPWTPDEAIHYLAKHYARGAMLPPTALDADTLELPGPGQLSA